MPTAFLTHPQPLGSTLGRAPCVPCQALLARAACRPCLERTWRHTEPAHTAAMGAGRLQEHWELWSPSREPHKRLGATAEQDQHHTDKTNEIFRGGTDSTAHSLQQQLPPAAPRRRGFKRHLELETPGQGSSSPATCRTQACRIPL